MKVEAESTARSSPGSHFVFRNANGELIDTHNHRLPKFISSSYANALISGVNRIVRDNSQNLLLRTQRRLLLVKHPLLSKAFRKPIDRNFDLFGAAEDLTRNLSLLDALKIMVRNDLVEFVDCNPSRRVWRRLVRRRQPFQQP